MTRSITAKVPGPPGTDLEQCFRLIPNALTLAASKRTPATHLGWAVQWGTVRMLGIFQADHPTRVPERAVSFVADQLDVDPGFLPDYRTRAQTAYEHAWQIRDTFGYREFTAGEEDLRAYLAARVWTSEEGPRALFDRAVLYLIEHQILLPGLNVLSRLVRQARRLSLQPEKVITMSLTWIFVLMFVVTAFPVVGTLQHQQQRMRADPHADLRHYNKIMMPLAMIPVGFMLVALNASSARWTALAGVLMGLAMVGTGAVLLYLNRESWNRIYGRDSSSPYYTSFLVRLPWPMTTAESMLYLLSSQILLLGGWALVVWGSIAALPLSLWWLLPPLAWPFMYKYLLWRPLLRLFVPGDYEQRWEAVTGQR